MSITDRFREFYGHDVVDQIYTYLVENEIIDEFNNVKGNNDDLFGFAVRYGIFDIVKFLYERANIEYDHGLILGFDTTLKSTPSSDTSNMTTGSSNDKVNVEVWDKFTRNRNICVNYLIRMKRYSKQRVSNKTFYYRFNSKYIDVLG